MSENAPRLFRTDNARLPRRHAGVFAFFPNGRLIRLFLGLGNPSSSIREESVDSSSGGVLLEGVTSSPSGSAFGRGNGARGGGRGSSGLVGTMSVLRERTICPEEKGRLGGGNGAAMLRIDARSCGWDCECAARVKSSPVQFTLQRVQLSYLCI